MKLLNGFSLASAALGALSLSFGLSLVACGSDSSSSNDDSKGSNGIAEYETLDEMVHCTKSHYGEVAHVAETDSIYECTSEGWVVADSAKVEEILSSSDSKSDSDGKSSGSKDDSDEKSSSSITASAEDTAKVETVKVDSVTVLGLAEKGPFTKGTVVNVYGLDSALNKSKTSFKGAVNDDKGNYSVSKIKLSSQYAMVEVNGFFNNEVTGKVTSGTKTKLRALVDLSEGDTVKANVNILTDLEYERAIALVKNDKYNVPAAKARATKEILAAFGVNVDSVTATKISLSGENAATNGLLAASVAVIGNLSLSKFQARLGDVAESLAATGSIGDTLRAEIADDLSLLDSNGAMVDIMKNIKALNAKATGVDSLLYAFWSDNYKLPACDAKAEETIAKNGNKLSSNYGAGYACTSNRWHKSTALDTELGLCVAKNEGKYETTKGGKYYTCKAGQWREITKEQYTLGACTEEIAKDVSKKYKSVDNKKYFVCKDFQWETISADEYELKDCGDDKNETVVATKTSKTQYVCHNGAWRKATAQEAAFGYCSKVDSTKFETLDKDSYACLEKGDWTKVDELIAVLGFCSGKNDNQYKDGVISETQMYFVCNEGQWEEISLDEFELKDCGSDNNEKLVVTKTSENSYVCLDGEWRKATDIEVAIGYICTAKNAGKFGKVESQDYHCDGKAWTEVTALEAELGLCADSTSTKWKQSSAGDYYNCSEKQWTAVAKETFILQKFCSKAINGTFEKYGETNYVCEDNAWRKLSDVENKFGYCKPSIKDSVVWTGSFTKLTGLIRPMPDTLDTKGKFFVCNGDKWVDAQRIDYWYGMCNENQQGVYKNFWSLWPEPLSDGVLNEAGLNMLKELVREYYMDQADFVYAKCEDGEWNPSTYAEVLMWKKNESCTDGDKDRKVTYSEGTFACFQEKWYETITDSRDGHVYRITTIGDQTWMAENLNYAYKGVKFFAGRDWASDSTSWCYDNLASNCSKYGRLYTWAAATDSARIVSTENVRCGYGDFSCWVRGACPVGWHLPSYNEWKALFDRFASATKYADTFEWGWSQVGYELKATGGWYSNGNGGDRFGFTALPAGFASLSKFDEELRHAYFWSSHYGRAWSFNSVNGGGSVNDYNEWYGFSVRCVKD